MKVSMSLVMTQTEMATMLQAWRRFGDVEWSDATKAILLAYGRGELVPKAPGVVPNEGTGE